MDSFPKVTAHRVSVANLEELLLQQYDHDFSESSEDKMEMSFEDNRFMTRAENSEVAPQDELKRSDGKVWYVLHHGVHHLKKGTIKVVFHWGATFSWHIFKF